MEIIIGINFMITRNDYLHSVYFLGMHKEKY